MRPLTAKKIDEKQHDINTMKKNIKMMAFICDLIKKSKS